LKHFDIKCPVSFGGIPTEVIPTKTVTRRQWKPSYMKKFLDAYDRAQESSSTLRIPAIDKGFYAKGKQIGWLAVSQKPYLEKLVYMPFQDLIAEGGMCDSVNDFANRYFGGNLDLEVWVIRYQFTPLEVTNE